MYTQRFDLIHFRDMFATFTDEQWRLIYKQAYDNLLPGGWIEQAETGVRYATELHIYTLSRELISQQLEVRRWHL